MAIEFEFPAVLLVRGPRVGGLGCLLEERGEGGTFSRDFGANGLMDCIYFASSWDGEPDRIAISGFMCIFWEFNLFH